MPYSQYYSDPAQYGIRQDENRQEQFRQLLNMIIASKQMKQEKKDKEREWGFQQKQYADKLAQAQWQQGQEERRTSADEKRAEATMINAKTPPKVTIPEQRQAYADYLLKSGNLSPKEYQQFTLTGTLPTKEGLTSYQEYSKLSTELSRSQLLIRNKLDDVDKKIYKIKEPMSMAEITGRALSGTLGEVKVDTEGIKNLETARTILTDLEMIVQNRPWTKDEQRILAYIAGNTEKISKEGLRTGTNQETGEKWIEINNKWIRYK